MSRKSNNRKNYSGRKPKDQRGWKDGQTVKGVLGLNISVTRPENHKHVPTPKERRKARWDKRVANVGSMFLEWAVWSSSEHSITAAPVAEPLMVAVGGLELPSLPPRPLIDQMADRLAEKSAGATFGPIPLPAIPGKVTSRV